MKAVWKHFRSEAPFLAALPTLLWQALFLYIPLCVMIFFSFLSYSDAGFDFALTVRHYTRLFSPIYLQVILNSFVLATLTCVICLFVAYPVSYFLSITVRRWKMLFLFLLILPSWTNLIVQIYAWFFLLERRGFFSSLLLRLGLISQPLEILNSFIATMIGMVYCFLPFMVLPIYTVLEKLDHRLFEASADLGASRRQTFLRVILPLSLPGIYAGSLLVFIPAFGEFVIPSLLGGDKSVYWGSLIVSKIIYLRNWSSGFALAWIGISFLLVLCLVVVLLRRVVKQVYHG